MLNTTLKGIIQTLVFSTFIFSFGSFAQSQTDKNIVRKPGAAVWLSQPERPALALGATRLEHFEFTGPRSKGVLKVYVTIDEQKLSAYDLSPVYEFDLSQQAATFSVKLTGLQAGKALIRFYAEYEGQGRAFATAIPVGDEKQRKIERANMQKQRSTAVDGFKALSAEETITQK